MMPSDASSLTFLSYALWAALLFLSGSIPFGLIFSKLLLKKDIRTIGSGNIGATNVLRSGSKKTAFLTLLFDFLKGYLPLILMSYFLAGHIANQNHLFEISLPLVDGPLKSSLQNAQLWTMLFVAPVLGHIFTPWLKFKGGKGIATGFGVLLAFSPLTALLSAFLWGATFWFTRISSVAGLVAYTCAIFFAGFFETFETVYWIIFMWALVIWSHRDNIRRLLQGRETKFGNRHKKPSEDKSV